MRLLSRDLQCEQAVQLVTDYLDGALSRRQVRRLERHLHDCPNCSAYLEQIRVTISLMGQVHTDELPEGSRDDLVQLFRKFHRDGDEPPSDL